MKLFGNHLFLAITLINILQYVIILCREDNDNEILYTLCLGSTQQCFPILVDTLSFHTLIHEKTFNKSASYTLRNTIQTITGERAIRAFRGFEYQDFAIHDGYTSEKFSFVMGNDIKSVLGLGLNYTDHVVVNEQYFFGCDIKYSYLHHLHFNGQIKNKVFSIEENRILIGAKHNNINLIHKCKCESNLLYIHYDFFWNCRFEEIILGNQYKIGYGTKIVIDSTLKGISFPISMTKLLQNALTSYTKGGCYLETQSHTMRCKKNYNMNTLPLLTLERSNLKLIIHSKEFFAFDEGNDFYYLNVKLEGFNEVIIIGKLLFENYYVEFNQEEGSLGFFQIHPITTLNDISSVNNSLSYAIVILIILSFGGIVMLVYTKGIILKRSIAENKTLYK